MTRTENRRCKKALIGPGGFKKAPRKVIRAIAKRGQSIKRGTTPRDLDTLHYKPRYQ